MISATPNVFELIVKGQYREAVIAADEEYAKTENVLPLRNKVLALLSLKEYGKAATLCDTITKSQNGESDSDFVYCGIAHWFLNNHSEAISLWQKSEHAKYSDIAGGIDAQVILFFAAVALKDDALLIRTKKKIMKLPGVKKSISWPGALGHYLLGNIDDERLMGLTTSRSAILELRNRCEAYFAIYVKALQHNNSKGASESLAMSLKYGRETPLEAMYYMAKGLSNE